MRHRFWIAGSLATMALLATSGIFEARSARAQVRTFFSPKSGSHEYVGGLVDGVPAGGTLDVAMYSISVGTPIWHALANAVKRGVQVRFIFNAARTKDNKPKSEALLGIGIRVRYVSKTMHEKFAVFNRKQLCNGSANWSSSAESKYSENTVCFLNHPEILSEFQDEFDRLWAMAKTYGGTATPPVQ